MKTLVLITYIQFSIFWLGHSVTGLIECLGSEYWVPSNYLGTNFPAVNHRCQDKGNKAPRIAFFSQLFLLICYEPGHQIEIPLDAVEISHNAFCDQGKGLKKMHFFLTNSFFLVIKIIYTYYSSYGNVYKRK